MSERFFHPTPISAERVTLDGSEAHHLLHVGRATQGQGVTLFDGSGVEFVAVVEKIGRSAVELRIVQRVDADRELPFPLVVGVALPKGDRQKWLVEKLTELGATALVPLQTERGIAQPTANALDRLRRSVVEASKQCGRNRLMDITNPQTWREWISPAQIAGDGHRAVGMVGSPDTRRFFAHPHGKPLNQLKLTPPFATRLAIGPEGGFTDAEVAAAVSAGWQAVALGPRILRVETAAVSLAAAIALHT